MLLYTACLLSLLLVSCNGSASRLSDESAKLVETYSVFTGNNRASYEFTTSDKTVSATVDHHHNAVTGDESTSGSLASIFEAVTGSPPRNPSDYQTTKSILRVLKENDWVIIDDTTRDQQDDRAMQSTIRTINFRRRIRDTKQ